MLHAGKPPFRAPFHSSGDLNPSCLDGLAMVANSPQLKAMRGGGRTSVLIPSNSMGLETSGNHEQAQEIHD
jgi:hypothetical protein